MRLHKEKELFEQVVLGGSEWMQVPPALFSKIFHYTETFS